MESKKELYHNGTNPNFYEAFDTDSTTRLLMALDDLSIPYTRMAHLEHGIKSLRFYVDNKNESRALLDKAEHVNIPSDEIDGLTDAYSHYALVYENAFV